MSSKKGFFLGFSFVVGISVIMHLLFSRFGFALSDDGFILGYSRRILEGQVPYRDFINIRTVLSAYLHAPIVLFGGEYTFWLSRFIVWFQFAVTSWIWIHLVEYFFNINLSNFKKIIYSLIAFIFMSNLSWLIVTQTIDIICIFSLGLFLYIRNKKFLGYCLIGTAFLFRQSFGLLPFVTIVLLKDYKQIKYWFAILLPSLVGLFYLLLNNALKDAFFILKGQGAILEQWKNNLFFRPNEFSLGVAIGFLILLLSLYRDKKNVFLIIRIVLVNFVIVFSGYKLYQGAFTYEATYFIVGILVGSVIFYFFNRNKFDKKIFKVSILVLFLAFSATFGMCNRSPVYISGIMMLLFLGYYEYLKQIKNIIDDRFEKVMLLLSGTFLLACFSYARMVYVFNDWPALKLKSSLSDVFKGGKLVKTNEYTYDLIKDLNEAVIKTQGYKYTILEWFCGWWVKNEQINPISIDLAVNPELPIQELTDKICDELVRKRGEILVIVPKVGSIKAANGLLPMTDEAYPYGKLTSPSWYLYSDVTRYVIKNFEKVDETKYFVIYK